MTDFFSLLTKCSEIHPSISQGKQSIQIHCVQYINAHPSTRTWKFTHLLFSSSILSVGTIMFPYSSMFWKDWKVFKCWGISSRQTCRSMYLCAYCVFIYIYIYIYGLDSISHSWMPCKGSLCKNAGYLLHILDEKKTQLEEAGFAHIIIHFTSRSCVV